MTRTPLRDQHARVPVDRTAARVIGKGVSFDSNVGIGQCMHDSDLPIPTAPTPEKLRNMGADLTGSRFGRLTVIGYHSRKAKPNGAHKHRWVVRCACGRYSVRRGDSLRRAKNPNECCERCDQLRIIKNRANNSY